ncbi:MAG TPA: HIRAN domain-containing protein [Acidimicrobiia bacterium]|nr:HIRAN domain-containing protein [Acidimicrobiia bacterium]
MISVIRVVGVSFRKPHYPGNLHRLSEIMDQAALSSITGVTSWADIDGAPETPAVVLCRAPDNPHDSNAIEVHVPALGKDAFVGFIPADLAVRWAPRLDADPAPIVEACVAMVAIDPVHPDKPGLDIRVALHRPDCGLHEDLPCSCGGGVVGRAPNWSI